MARAQAQALQCCRTRVDVLPLGAVANEILSSAVAAKPLAVHLCNAYTLSLARRDATLRTALDRGDVNAPDGMPLVWLARRKGLAAEGRVYGPDLMLAVLERGLPAGVAHYLYGSTPDVLHDLESRLRTRFPDLRIAGVESPPFRSITDDEAAEVAARIRASGAGVVWVGIGTPRQDLFVDRMRDAIGVPLVAVGAAFDFHAGRKAQAPAWMQERGLEWAFRLATEPRRLWRRYLLGNAAFLAGVAFDGVRVIDHSPQR